MPAHTIGATFADDAGSVPLVPTTFIVPAEVNMLLAVPAGAVNLEFDVPFLHSKVVDYCIAVGTQTAAQVQTGKYSVASAGSILVNVNSTSSPAPALTVQAGQAQAFSSALPGTTNVFAADVTKFYCNNAGALPLVLIVKIGLNT